MLWISSFGGFFFVWLLLPHHVSWIYIFVVSILSRGSIGKKSFLELREPDFFSFSLRSQSRLSWHSSFFPHFYFNYCISGSRNGFHFFSLTRNIICFIYMCTMLCDPFRIIHSFGKLTIKDYLYVGYTHTFGEFNVTCSEWKREREKKAQYSLCISYLNSSSPTTATVNLLEFAFSGAKDTSLVCLYILRIVKMYVLLN